MAVRGPSGARYVIRWDGTWVCELPVGSHTSYVPFFYAGVAGMGQEEFISLLSRAQTRQQVLDEVRSQLASGYSARFG